MSANIAVEIMGVDPGLGPEFYQLGDVVAAYRAEQVGEWNGSEYRRIARMKRTVFLFLRDVPVKDHSQFDLSNVVLVDSQGDPILKVIYGIDFDRIPRQILEKLKADGFATVKWSKVKGVLKRIDEDRGVEEKDLLPFRDDRLLR